MSEEPKPYEGHVIGWFHSGGPDEADTSHVLYRGQTALLDGERVLTAPIASFRAITALVREGYRVVIGRRKADGNG